MVFFGLLPKLWITILFQPKWILKTIMISIDYSACSNPTNVALVIILNMIIGKGLDNETAKFDRCVITQAMTKTINQTTLVGFEHALQRQ